jgi:hypothetical protein
MDADWVCCRRPCPTKQRWFCHGCQFRSATGTNGAFNFTGPGVTGNLQRFYRSKLKAEAAGKAPTFPAFVTAHVAPWIL